MDRQEYLNQISTTSKPKKKASGKTRKLLSPKFFWIGGICVGLFILMAIIGGVLNGNKGGEKNKAFALKLHLDGTTEVIAEYQKSVKSSALRSSSAALANVLSGTNRDLTAYLTEKYNFKVKDVDKGLSRQAKLEKDGLTQELFEAKINGNLDRVYAHKMAYEIALIANEEAAIIKATGNEAFKAMLTESYNSLDNLYDDFNDFSEAK